MIKLVTGMAPLSTSQKQYYQVLLVAMLHYLLGLL